MKKINTKIWLLGLALAVGLLCSTAARAGAAMPFFSTTNVRPDVLIVIDTSGSMAWCQDCANDCCGYVVPTGVSMGGTVSGNKWRPCDVSGCGTSNLMNIAKGTCSNGVCTSGTCTSGTCTCGGTHTGRSCNTSDTYCKTGTGHCTPTSTCTDTAAYSKYKTCTSAGGLYGSDYRRIDVVETALTGSGKAPVKVGSKNVYMGQPGGNLSVWNDMNTNGAFVPILLVRQNPIGGGTYALTTPNYYQTHMGDPYYETFWFLYEGPSDLQLAKGTTATTIANAAYTLDRLMVDYAVDEVSFGGTYQLTNDAVNYQRPLWMPNAVTGFNYATSMENHYGDKKDLWVYRVKKTANCYNTTHPCYKPAPFPVPLPIPPSTLLDGCTALTFAIELGSTENANMQLADPLHSRTNWDNSRMKLSDFMVYERALLGLASTYSYYSVFNVAQGNTTQVCGDGVGLPDSTDNCTALLTVADGYLAVRIIQAIGTSGTLVHTPTYLESEVTTAMTAAIPNRQLQNVYPAPDAYVGPEFSMTVATSPEDAAVREGLDYGLGSGQRLYGPPWTRTICLNDATMCNFFGYIDTYGNFAFTGLPYAQLTTEKPGIMDTYDARFGLMIYDNANDATGQNDFAGVGANLIYNLSEGATNNLYIQEVVSQKDQNYDGLIGTCTTLNAACPFYEILLKTPSNGTPLAPAIRDIFTYLYDHYFTSSPNAGGEKTWTGEANSGPTNTTPSMFTWDASYITTYAMTPYQGGTHSPQHNGHVLLNDPYFWGSGSGKDGCRKSNVILLTDGGGNLGFPLGANPGSQLDANTVNKAEAKYVHYLGNPTEVIGGSWNPTKVYAIGLGTLYAATTDRIADDLYAPGQLKAIADASCKWDADPSTDICVPLFAGNAQQLDASFATIMNKIMEGAYMRSAPTISANMSAGSAGYFEITSDYLWQGHFLYVPLTGATVQAGASVQIGATIDAGVELLNRTQPRAIFTSVWDGSSVKYKRKPFDTVAADVTALDTSIFPTFPSALVGEDQDLSGGNTLTDNDTQLVIDFIRGTSGVRYNDGVGSTVGTLKTWDLGAIYHSTSIPLGPPPKEAMSGQARYQAYAAAKANYPELAIVGALDGMLHAFRFEDPDGSGTRKPLEEAFAYVPNYVLPSLYNLRDGEQVITVDGDPNMGIIDSLHGDTSPSPQPAYCDTVTKRCWQTIIFSGLRDGGASYFSLNLSDVSPTYGDSQKKLKVNWEFIDPDDGGTYSSILGASWSLPFVDEVQYNPAGGSTTPDTKVIVVFGGGRALTHRNREASWLYVLDSDSTYNYTTGAGNTTQAKMSKKRILNEFYVPGKNQYCNVATGTLLYGSTIDHTSTTNHFFNQCNMSVNNYNQVPGDAKIVDRDGDAFPDWIYFGDEQGRVWKAVIHDKDPANWGICLFFDTGDKGLSATPPKEQCTGDLRLYKSGVNPACVNTAQRRPIWYRPAAGPAPSGGGYMVYVGTGTLDDPTTANDPTQQNWVIALEDDDTVGTVGGCHYAKIWTKNVAGTYLWPIKLSTGELLTSPPIFMPVPLWEVNFKAEIGFQTYKPTESANICNPGTSYKWEVDYDSGQGGLMSAGVRVRFIKTPGMAGKGSVLGTTTLSFDPKTGKFTEGNTGLNPLLGMYFWWVK